MTTASWITMIAITGIVWGGFAVLLTLALRKESRKRPHAGHEGRRGRKGMA